MEFSHPLRQAAFCCWQFSHGWMPWDQKMQSLRASAHDRCGPANHLTIAKPLTCCGLDARRYLVEGRVIADWNSWQVRCNTFVVFIVISEKVGKLNVHHRKAQAHQVHPDCY